MNDTRVHARLHAIVHSIQLVTISFRMRPCALIPEIQFARAKLPRYVFEHKLGLKMTTRSLSVFLVEDEALIRMMIADMVADLGHHVVAEADNISDASDYAMTANYDLAILDINLRGLSRRPRRRS